MISDDPVFGQVLDNFPVRRGRMLVVAGVICVLVAGVLEFTVARRPVWWGPTLTVIVMGLTVVAVGWYVLHLWNREVVVYQRGFSYREGSQVVLIPYNEVVSVHQYAEQLAYFGFLRRTVYRTTIKTAEDETVVLTNQYGRIDKLGELLEARINLVLKDVVRGKLQRGERVAFSDRLALSADGLHVDAETLAWQEFGGHRIEQRQLLLLNAAGETWKTLPIRDLENTLLLLDLLRERRPTTADY